MADPPTFSMTGGAQPVSASVNPAYWEDSGHLTSTPQRWIQPSPHRALTVPEIAGIVEDYRRAAQNAMAAGFIGVELQATNGHLMDQFLQTTATNAPMSTVAQSQTGHASCWR